MTLLVSPLGRSLCLAHRRSVPSVSSASRWLRSLSINNHLCPRVSCRYLSQKIEAKPEDDAQRQNQPTVAKQRVDSVGEPKAQPFREPFMKSLIVGRFDAEFLGYPEISKPRLRFLSETFLPPIADLLSTETAKNMGTMGDGSSIIDELKRLGLFGMTISKEFGGLEMSSMETCRLLEAIGEHPGLFCRFLSHCGWVTQLLTVFGTQEQKEKYLPAMASGEKLGAWCFSEENSGFDARCFETRAITSIEDGTVNISTGEYLINGEKRPVVNGADADFFVVFAKTESEDRLYNKVWETTAFILDRNAPGVEVTPIEFAGMAGAGMAMVKFNNVRAFDNDIVGSKNEAYEHAIRVLGESHYLSGALCVAQMKKMVKEVIEFCVPRNSMLEPYYKHDLVRERIARMSTKTLLAESVLYGTSGLIDSGEYPEFQLESAAAKIFCSEAAFEVALEASRQLGVRSVITDVGREPYLKNTFPLWLLGSSNDMLRIFIALRSIEYAASEMQMAVTVQRNPYDHPQIVFKKGVRTLLDQLPFSKPSYTRLKYFLHGHLHPSLRMQADELEKFVLRYPHCVESALTECGAHVGARQVILRQIADVSMGIFAISCGLARASRSHCIGLKNSSLEMAVVSRASEEVFDDLRENLDRLAEPALGSLQHRLCDSGKKIMKTKDYCFEHALTHNWD